MTVESALAKWIGAERAGDAAALDAILSPDFVGVGPFGFLLDRADWIRRFSNGLSYTSFDFTADLPIRQVGTSAVVVGTQTQQGTHDERPIDGAFRVTLTFAPEPTRHLAAIQLSLRYPPTPPGGQS